MEEGLTGLADSSYGVTLPLKKEVWDGETYGSYRSETADFGQTSCLSFSWQDLPEILHGSLYLSSPSALAESPFANSHDVQTRGRSCG